MTNSVGASLPGAALPTLETGWVIERGSKPIYWGGLYSAPHRQDCWSELHQDAVRFARFQDAYMVASWLGIKDTAHIVEHSWTGAALEAGPSSPDVTGWLIEGQASGQPVWWTGEWYPRYAPIVYGPLHSAYTNPTSMTDMEPKFSPDHAEALRFARQRDAERAVGLLPIFYRTAVRVNEHRWVGAAGKEDKC